jgi:5-(carboxyamino)imidazole ribonucleotide synthase
VKLGILGGGQLARMLSLAAYPLGISTVCLDPGLEVCASQVTQVIRGDFKDFAAVSHFLNQVDAVTYETENIPLECANWAAKIRLLYPSAQVLQIAQDRLFEKNFFQNLNIPTPDFVKVDSESELKAACDSLNFPVVLKTRRMGYDGKGQIVIRSSSELSSAWEKLGKNSLILEKFIPFQYEVSLISVRSALGEIRFYPLVRNKHHEGILRWSEAPHEQAEIQRQAQEYTTRILEKFNYVGVFTIEFFFDGSRLLANEMAPRVHNSGHWTIEGAQTSQFENHLRAMFNLPLGSTNALGRSFMVNCIGQMPPLLDVLKIPAVHYHCYGKAPRALRKLGHLTLAETDSEKYHKSKNQLSLVVKEDS